MKKIGSALALGVLLLGLASAGMAMNGQPSREEALRQVQVVERLKGSLIAESTPAGRVALLKRTLEGESSVAIRRSILDAATRVPGLELDAFLFDVLAGDTDAGIRSQAATALGRLGSENGLPVLARTAAADPTTDMWHGCRRSRSSARRAATFAIAELAARFPGLAGRAADSLRALRPAADPGDTERLADARIQALYRITRDEALLQQFYERLQSPNAGVRVEGLVAFRFLGLKTAPAELLAALNDDDPEVRSWAILVVGEITNQAE
jgi:HEAT repeat protein